MDTVWQDLRYAARALRKNPAFTLVAVLTLALGIGASTAIFSVVNGVLLRPLPYPKPDQLMLVFQVNPQGGRSAVSDPNFEDLQAQNRSFQALAQFGGQNLSVSGGSEPARLRAAVVSREFLTAVGVSPALGRPFLPEELHEGAAPVALVSHAYWEKYLGSDPKISEKKLTLRNRVYALAGVMPRGFSFPAGADLWLPREQFPRLPSRTAHNWQVIGRVREGVGASQARAELSGIAKRLRAQYGGDTWMVDAAVIPLHEGLVANVRAALLVLLGAVHFLLLVACANVTNLLLAQAGARQRELAMRLALGASHSRLVRQFLAESMALALMGGALGVLFAMWGVDLLLAFEPGRLPRLKEISVNVPVLAFALGVSALLAIALGLLTGLGATPKNVQEALKAGQRTQAGAASSHRLRSALVVSQMAITLILLVGAGLLGRSFVRLLAVPVGFQTENRVAMDIARQYPESAEEKARLAKFYEELIPRLRALPGIEAVGGANVLPLSGGDSNGTFLILDKENIRSFEEFEQVAKNPEITGQAEFRIASEGYFQAMGIPLVRGRMFDERDAPDSPHAALISESLARQRWPKEDPIGKRIQFGNMDGDLRLFTIVGIVGDVLDVGLDSDPRPTFYGYYRQRPATLGNFSLVLCGQADAAAVVSAARGILRGLSPETPARFRTLAEVYSASLADRRFNLLLLGVFAAAALLLAALGVYGVMAHAVTRRTQEIGIRMALGAQRGHVLQLILTQGARLAGLGLVLGCAGAYWLTRLIRGLLFNVAPNDPATFTVGALFLAGIALLACYLPARRAARVDPMVALRYE